MLSVCQGRDAVPVDVSLDAALVLRGCAGSSPASKSRTTERGAASAWQNAAPASLAPADLAAGFERRNFGTPLFHLRGRFPEPFTSFRNVARHLLQTCTDGNPSWSCLRASALCSDSRRARPPRRSGARSPWEVIGLTCKLHLENSQPQVWAPTLRDQARGERLKRHAPLRSAQVRAYDDRT